MAPSARQRRLHRSRAPASSSSTRTFSSRTASRRRAFAIGAAAWKHRASSISRTNGSGAGTGRCCRTRPTCRITASTKPCSPPTCSSRPRTTPCPSSTSRDAATAATSTRARNTIYGFSLADDQKQIPVIHPVIDHDYVFKSPIFGGELGFRNNLTSLSRDTANFDPISQAAVTGNLCARRPPIPRSRTPNNCLLRGVPGNYTRAIHRVRPGSAPSSTRGARCSRRSSSMRADVADINVTDQPGVSNYHQCRPDRRRARHADRRPRISLSAHQRADLGHADDRADRPAHRPSQRDQCRLIPQRGCAKPDLRRFEPVQGEQVLRLGPRGRRRPGECRRAIHRPVQPRRQRQHPVRTVLSALRTELLRARRHDQYRPQQRPRYGAVRLCRARVVSAELHLHFHLAVPHGRERLHAAAHRARDHRRFRPLDDIRDVRQLRRPAPARLSRAPRGRSRQRPVQSEPELGPARCSAI